jgi:hypothetical protein
MFSEECPIGWAEIAVGREAGWGTLPALKNLCWRRGKSGATVVAITMPREKFASRRGLCYNGVHYSRGFCGKVGSPHFSCYQGL